MTLQINEAVHAGAFLITELDDFLSRANGTFEAGQTLVTGTVLGRLTGVPPTSPNVGTPVKHYPFGGGGTMALAATPYDAATQLGTYRVVCTTPAAGAGTFTIYDPSGNVVGTEVAGVAFATQIHFTVTAAGVDFMLDDEFRVTVTLPQANAQGQWVAFNPAGTGGAQNAAGINIYPVTSTTTPISIQYAVLTNNAAVRASDLTWPAGITLAQMSAAIAQLNAQGIVLRQT
jgi:hypothetical protein